MNNRILLFLLLALLASCGSKKPPLEGLWVFNENSLTGNSFPECFLNLKKNGRYTLFIPDYFDYGYWRKSSEDSSHIVFLSKRTPQYYGGSFTAKIQSFSDDKLVISYTLPAHIDEAAGNDDFTYDQVRVAVDEHITLQRAEVQYPDSLDPYSYSLNRWRIRPAVPESCKEISRRMVNYLRHMHALFSEQHRQQSKLYGYPFSPSPLLYGRNGIATINFDEIPEYWKYTFYDHGQAKQGCAILYALFDEKLHIPKDYKRPDELWANLLRQMTAYALQRDFCSNGQGLDTAVVD